MCPIRVVPEARKTPAFIGTNAKSLWWLHI
jgi:hypothetical protein